MRVTFAVSSIKPAPDFLARGALAPDVEIAVDALIVVDGNIAEAVPEKLEACVLDVRIPLGVSSQFVAQDVNDPPADFRAIPKIAGQFVGVDVLGELDQVLLVHDVSFR